jgi:DNA polymerase-3 subunit delta
MPAATAAAVRKQIAAGRPDPVYLIVGDDDAEVTRLAGEFTEMVDEALRAFNVERLYASDKAVTPAAIAEAARQLPMMADRRVVVVLRAEKILKPRRRKADEEAGGSSADEEPSGSAEALEAYLARPEPSTVLVFAAADVDRTRRLYKQLQKAATIVECWGLKSGPAKGGRVDPREAVQKAEQLVKQRVSESGQRIEPRALRLLASRAGTDIARLRNDVERLLLYAAGKPSIGVQDVEEIVGAETSQDDWAVTNAIRNGRTADALRELALALDAGGVPFMILGQLAYYVRERMIESQPRRVPAAIDALFRTDLDMKSSGGDPRVLLERLVVELCEGARRPASGSGGRA